MEYNKNIDERTKKILQTINNKTLQYNIRNKNILWR